MTHEQKMRNKLGASLAILTLLSGTSLAQVPGTPPPWYNAEQSQKQNALPEIDNLDLENQDIEQPASRLEEFYRLRTKNETLEQFGYKLFSGTNIDTTQTPTGAVQEDYILGTGDELLISFTGQRNDQTISTISPQGQIIIKDFPPIPAAGRSIAALRSAINTHAQSMPNTQAYVSLSKIKQIGVLIAGHVKEPGKKSLNSFQTVYDALRIAGGIDKQGSLRQIKLIRGGLSKQIDIYELLVDGASGTDISLKNGDRIIVPPIGATLAITGAIKRPAIYELKNVNSTVSLSKILKYGGGVLSPGQNRFMRQAPSKSGEEIIEQITNQTKPLFRNGNILNVLRGTDKLLGAIELIGHTNKPGLYDSKKYKYLSEILKNNGVITPNIYPLIAIIERQNKTLLSREFITFSPQSVSKNTTDLKIQENDRIILLSNSYISKLYSDNNIETKRPKKDIKKKEKSTNKLLESQDLESFLREQNITLRGAVRKPGSYPIAQSVSMSAIIAAAGGTTRQANLENIELTKTSPHNAETTRSILNIDPVTGEYSDPNEINLSPGDSLRVNQNQKAIKENTVLIIGEVKHPGEYDLLPGDNVSSLLKRAGSLTEQAYPAGAIFSRESERKTEEMRYRKTARDLERRLAATIENDSKKQPNATQIAMVRELSEELSSIQAVGRITAELDPDILDLKPELDMLLEHGDKIYIPKRPLNVRVVGEVFSPAALQFRSGKDPRDYINEAGGFTKAADKIRTFVLYPNGSAQPLKVSAWNHTPIKIPPASTIVVPLDPKPFNFLHSAKEIGQIIGNLAVTAVFIDDIRD